MHVMEREERGEQQSLQMDTDQLLMISSAEGLIRTWRSQAPNRQTHTQVQTCRRKTVAPESEQVFIMPLAGRPATLLFALFTLTFSSSALHFLLPHSDHVQEITHAIQSQDTLKKKKKEDNFSHY